jgi:hypothetical protein
MSYLRKELPLVIVALLAGVAITAWVNEGSALVLMSADIQMRFVELYVQVLGILLGFYGVIITLRSKPSSSDWLYVPVMVFLICIVMELVSLLQIGEGVEGPVAGVDFSGYLANFMFLLGIFTFAIALVLILRLQKPEQS